MRERGEVCLMETINVDELKPADETEALQVLVLAFAHIDAGQHPGAAATPRMARTMLRVLPRLHGRNAWTRLRLGIAGRFSDQLMYGIRQEGKLVCVAVLQEGDKRPASSPFWLTLVGALFGCAIWVGRMLRWQPAIEFYRTYVDMAGKLKQSWHAPHLKLLSLGTLPAYQNRGLGRKMLRSIRAMAENRGVAGIELITTSQNNPAMQLYLREGFVVEKEYVQAGTNVLFMRLALPV